MKASEAVKKWYRDIGKRGGKQGARNMTPEQRKERAQKAATARWKTPQEVSQ